MNTEEKAKAYDDALKIAQCWLNSPQTIEDCGYTVEDAIQSIFPVLKESEDERIRKSLMEYIKRNSATPLALYQNFTPEQYISYLEKQKDITSVASIQEAYRKGFNNAIEAVKQKPEKYGLQKEQKQKMEEQQ